MIVNKGKEWEENDDDNDEVEEKEGVVEMKLQICFLPCESIYISMKSFFFSRFSWMYTRSVINKNIT